MAQYENDSVERMRKFTWRLESDGHSPGSVLDVHGHIDKLGYLTMGTLLGDVSRHHAATLRATSTW